MSDSVFKPASKNCKLEGRSGADAWKRSRKDIKQLQRSQSRVNKISSIRKVVEAVETHWRHPGFGTMLDMNSDVVGCNGGVIDLRTGTWRPGRPKNLVRKLHCCIHLMGRNMPMSSLFRYPGYRFTFESLVAPQHECLHHSEEAITSMHARN